MRRVLAETSFCILIVLIFTACTKKIYPEGHYQESAVTIDGELNEWPQPLAFSSNGGRLQYSITNDRENVYVSLLARDEITALRILRSGITIYIDPEAGESKKMSLAFPIGVATQPGDNKMGSGNLADLKEYRLELLLQTTVFNTTGFNNMENRMYDLTDKSRMRLALKSFATNGLSYEAAIPLKYIFGNVTASQLLTHNLSVGVFINGMGNRTNSYRGQGNESGGYTGGMRGGGGQRGGGGRGMGSGGGGNYRRSNGNENNEEQSGSRENAGLIKDDIAWYKFKLASPNK